MNLEKKISIWGYIKTNIITKICLSVAGFVLLIAFARGVSNLTTTLSNDSTFGDFVGCFTAIFLIALLGSLIIDKGFDEHVEATLAISAFCIINTLIGAICNYCSNRFFDYNLPFITKTDDLTAIVMSNFIIGILAIGAVMVACLMMLAIKPAIKFVRGIYSTLRIYKQMTYMPMTEKELLAKNIYSPRELEEFFVNVLFKDIRRSEYLLIGNIKDTVMESYAKSIKIYLQRGDFSNFPGNYALTRTLGEEEIERIQRLSFKMAELLLAWLTNQKIDYGCFKGEEAIGHIDWYLLRELQRYSYIENIA